MRTFLCLMLLSMLAGGPGCGEGAGASMDYGAAEDSPPSGGGGAGDGCAVAEDCVAVGASCCDCPSFASPVGSGRGEGCEELDCEPPADCPRVEATCVHGACELRCSPIVTEQVCSYGFDRDAFGCLLDACAGAAPATESACTEDSDCVRVRADCCGCERGGSDTAVRAGEEEAFLSGLDCSKEPQCPEVDVCDPEQAPRCVGGACRLSTGSGDPDPGVEPDGGSGSEEAALCGTPELGACPEGQACVLNDPEAKEAAEFGVGVCRPE